MSNKAIDKDYLLTQLKNFESIILSPKYQKTLTAGGGIEIDATTNTISTEVPWSVASGMVCITYDD